MNPDKQDLQYLAQQTQAGDSRAKDQLQGTLEPSMNRIVRRVLERGQAGSKLEQKILAIAQRLQAGHPPAFKDQAEQVSRNLCQMVVNRLWPGHTDQRLQTLSA